MVTILIVIAIAAIAGGVIIGIFSGSVLGFIFSVLSAVVSSAIFLALAKIIDNQQIIISYLIDVKEDTKKPEEIIVCKFCNKEYSDEYSSCPHCGRK